MRKIIFFLIVLFFSVPLFAIGDGGIVYWPPNVYLEEKGQKAILAWNGEEEILILSNDFETKENALALRIIPFPSKPEIKEGKFESFEKIVEIMNKKIEEIREKRIKMKKGGGIMSLPEEKIKIFFKKQIGVHNITAVKVSNLESFIEWIEEFVKEKNLKEKEITFKLRKSIENYLKKEINYFVFDVIDLQKGEKSSVPLIYKFKTDYLYYPLEITSASEIKESYGIIQIFLITPDTKIGSRVNLPLDLPFPITLSLQELSKIEEDLVDLFSFQVSQVNVRNFNWSGKFSEFKGDLIIFPQIWKRNLKIGDKGEDVKALQKILINYGYWKSKEKPKDFFDVNTKKALISLQEEFKEEILKPWNLEKGTGYFGQKSREFFEKTFTIFLNEKVLLKKEIAFPRNLYWGLRGEDVGLLQYLLIEEKVWKKKDIQPTGYFGPITYSSVVAFQEKYKKEILAPLGLKKGTGFVGPLTRKVLEKIYKRLVEKYIKY